MHKIRIKFSHSEGKAILELLNQVEFSYNPNGVPRKHDEHTNLTLSIIQDLKPKFTPYSISMKYSRTLKYHEAYVLHGICQNVALKMIDGAPALVVSTATKMVGLIGPKL